MVDSFNDILEGASTLTGLTPGQISTGAAIVGGGALLAGGTMAAVAIAKRRKRKKSKSKRSRSRSHKGRRKGRRYTPRTAGKGRDRSTKRIRYTKNGQPYVIMRSGKARFIKMSSAKRSHRLKGGRY